MSLESCLKNLRAAGAAIPVGSITETMLGVAYQAGVVDGGKSMAETVEAALTEAGVAKPRSGAPS